ncbi:MAG: hypothetical protein AB8B64_16385 [Granulosicoccus sp.]
MIGSILSRFKRTRCLKALGSILLLIIIACCLVSIDTLNKDQTRISEIERNARNASASALYITLATLHRPATTSDITHALLQVIRNDELIRGATLLDANGKLLAQLGSGNDSLLQHPTSPLTARIPISSTESELFGHALVAFQPARGNLAIASHYVALSALAILLALVGIALFHTLWQLPGAIVVLWRANVA